MQRVVGGEVEEAVVRVVVHTAEGKFFFLREVDVELYVVRRALVGHEEADERPEQALAAHEDREDGLVGCDEAGIGSLAHEVVQVGGAAAPVTDDEDHLLGLDLADARARARHSRTNGMARECP